MLAEIGDYFRTNSSNGFSSSCYNKEKLSGDLLESDFVNSSFDDTTLHSMLSSSINADPEQSQKPQQRHKNQSSCHQELKIETEDQQEPYLLPDMLTKNIFNSQSSMFVYSSIPQISSVQSFIDTNTFSAVDGGAAPEGNSLSVDSTLGLSSDQSFEKLYSYDQNFEKEPQSPACPLVKCDPVSIMKTSTNSLETAVNTKRRMFQLRNQNEIESLNVSSDIVVATSKFLNHSWIPLIRGRNFGGSNCKPPKKPLFPGARYVTARLRLEYSSCKDMCLPEWNEYELEDSRRIIRIERLFDSNEIVASFSIVGSAVENPETRPVFNPNVKVLEVSCLRCLTNNNESDEENCVNKDLDGRNRDMVKDSFGCKYYITSVEVIKIIELLVGSSSISDPHQMRKERGRVRSNLAQFWSKRLVSSSRKTMKQGFLPTCNDDYFAELAHRINTYDVRKPRLFDKCIKILEWSKLKPALQRAMQSYYMVQLDESSNKIATANN
ncbi:Hypothetical protein PP7435_CHR1-0001 [Komagataella phaffii CBS 7435]|uniref:DUF7082 domain-containing protein n=2 Tax=Komagataella phaffii TaxID=460519 RepID=C4QUY9_KOMPG|nr:Hypothetical protein PAS_chr1-3_0003 [Komagataella phaffii GS115]AOA61176.1 GQ67_02256T0 [Komagataella phaffii]CAH2445710.1 Hypothetical protein BQ9382_C1-0005 [Komagataella phaffii CBS 7435]AOA65887.1 GQ68_02991T0 [Komagataella phaffii GS115]CAY67059.1 Hypothetical protein PAS_chr1-3_0003 [Komagataella phaffii GS115]CCA36173.1 Hypothetical protein PP7435_CHR1-0001 [Komagataella phaffii CBS 7435]